METNRNLILPKHIAKRYDPIDECIYCGRRDALSDEHIIPFAAGGRWVLPAASCQTCATITGRFEGEVLRTIIGPLRMLYDFPTRRKKDRPKQLSLKVKYALSTDWEEVYVDRNICPFLVGLPLYPLPSAITGSKDEEDTGAATSSIWIRGAGFWRNRDSHLEWLCEQLGAVQVMPTATIHTEPFCLLLAKVAHSFAVAELGLDSFFPFLTNMILTRNVSERGQFIGGGSGNEPASERLHDLAINTEIGFSRNIVVVQVRILGCLETPTYYVAVGNVKG